MKGLTRWSDVGVSECAMLSGCLWLPFVSTPFFPRGDEVRNGSPCWTKETRSTQDSDHNEALTASGDIRD